MLSQEQINEILQPIIDSFNKGEFRDARDWKQFHNPKDLALAINVE